MSAALTSAVTAGGLLVATVAGARGTWSPCGLSMISAINPMAERSRGNRYWLTCLWFWLGALAGGAALGAAGALLAAAAAPLLAAVPAAVAGGVVLVAVVCVASDARVGPVRLPLLPRQVNERWLADYRRWVYAAGFGVQIGVGFSTYVMTAANYLLVVLMAASGSPARALALGVAFGAVRGLAVTLSAGARDPQRLRALHRTLERLDRPSLLVAQVAQAVAAVVVVAAVVSPVAALVVAAACGAVVSAEASRRRGRTARRGRPGDGQAGHAGGGAVVPGQL